MHSFQRVAFVPVAFVPVAFNRRDPAIMRSGNAEALQG
jgi:hypothetical protein